MTLCQLLTLADHHQAAHSRAPGPQQQPQDSGGPFGLLTMAQMARM